VWVAFLPSVLLRLQPPRSAERAQGICRRRPVSRALDVLEKAIAARPEVMECYLMTGDSDYLLRVVVPGVPALEHFIVNVPSRVPWVGNIRSSFTLKQVKYKTALPLGEPASGTGPTSRSGASRHPAKRRL